MVPSSQKFTWQVLLQLQHPGIHWQLTEQCNFLCTKLILSWWLSWALLHTKIKITKQKWRLGSVERHFMLWFNSGNCFPVKQMQTASKVIYGMLLFLLHFSLCTVFSLSFERKGIFRISNTSAAKVQLNFSWEYKLKVANKTQHTKWVRNRDCQSPESFIFVTWTRTKLWLNPLRTMTFLLALILAVWFTVVVITKAVQFKSNEMLSW